MTGDDLRALFLSFFEEKGHKVIPGSSLIPHGDPTLLLTTAGMVQIKPYFLGEAVPPSPRLASCQKCFRTTDIELVGDTTHLTFFEMLGNFSVGDYFKKEAIVWAWEFVTRRLGLATERLWITIFTDDDESFGFWREIGVPQSRILRFGEKDNFWGPAGNCGPCGPCSEIHYDFGEEFGCGRASCGPGCDCGRFSEIWNLVFTQYNQDEAGNRTPLPKPNIDTGMGLERTAAVLQGKASVYETDLFLPLVKRISELSGKEYGSGGETDNALRIVAEHARGIAFLIADGVTPSNARRGHVLRRLLRRGTLFGKRLGMDRPFLFEMVKATVKLMGHVYPEVAKRQGFITRLVKSEEVKFGETLTTGLELIESVMAKPEAMQAGEISGEDAFKLHDSRGLNIELIQEIAASRGLSVNLGDFEKEMAKQQERARAAQKFKIKPIVGMPGVSITDVKFVGYDSLKHRSEIAGLASDEPDKIVTTVSKGHRVEIFLRETPFYAEMGGQVGDTGEIRGSSGRFTVTDAVRVPPDVIVHQGYVNEGSLSVGDEVEAEVDKERRLDIARNHTATHLLQLALRQVLGEHVQQRGSLVSPERFRFDFSQLVALAPEELDRVQGMVNEEIRRNLPVYAEELSYKKAVGEGAIALFDEKYADVVRVLKVGKPPISSELCGGTHVRATGEIGFFKVISEMSIGSGLRRIEAVTGRGAEALVSKRLSDLQKTADYLDAELDDVCDKTSSLGAELKHQRQQTLAIERLLAKKEVESLLTRTEVINGVTVLTARVSSHRIEVLREMTDLLRGKLESAIIVLGTVYQGKPAFVAAVTPDLVGKGYHAGEIVKKVAQVTGGGGGGKATLAQAGGKFKDKLDEALKLVKSLI